MIDISVKKIGSKFDFDYLYTIKDVSIIEKENNMEKLFEDLYFRKVLTECENNILYNQKRIGKKEDFKNIYLKFFG